MPSPTGWQRVREAERPSLTDPWVPPVRPEGAPYQSSGHVHTHRGPTVWGRQHLPTSSPEAESQLAASGLWVVPRQQVRFLFLS